MKNRLKDYLQLYKLFLNDFSHAHKCTTYLLHYDISSLLQTLKKLDILNDSISEKHTKNLFDKSKETSFYF